MDVVSDKEECKDRELLMEINPLNYLQEIMASRQRKVHEPNFWTDCNQLQLYWTLSMRNRNLKHNQHIYPVPSTEVTWNLEVIGSSKASHYIYMHFVY